VGKLYERDAIWRTPVGLKKLVATALCLIATTMLCNDRADLDPVFLELGGVRDRMFYKQIGCHVILPNDYQVSRSAWSRIVTRILRQYQNLLHGKTVPTQG